MKSLVTLYIPELDVNYASFSENVEIVYNGCIPPDEDPADYMPRWPKGVRIA